ncbi:DUF4215 domain-containing protein, partial [Candidatus Falkowbacteria bacterium]|nr:DUF4215 domain-containing protein [Candidatus Falkowbacteria bacterium]
NTELDDNEECDDGNTIDGDGCSSSCQIESVLLPACSDGIDNDGDGLTDYPDDPGCLSPSDDDEYNTPEEIISLCGNNELDDNEECDDGNTIDGDGCSSSCQIESVLLAACSDGIDNDGDGLTDYPDDPGCLSPSDDDEYNFIQIIQLTEELAVVHEVSQFLAELPGVRQVVASAPVQFLNQLVFSNPNVEAVNQKIATPTVVLITIVNTAAALPSITFLPYIRFIFTEPWRFFLYRRRKYGVVYDSLTKRPVDLMIVRLYDNTTNKLVATQVTDSKGRYSFVANPGQYYLKAQKQDYVFPSSVLGQQIRDGNYADIYYGAPVTLTDKDTLVSLNIPVDTNKRQQTDAEVYSDKSSEYFKKVIAFVGPTLAVLAWLVSPTPLVTGILLVHFILFFVFKRLALTYKPKAYGSIFDLDTKEALAKAIVRIFDTKYNKLLDTQIANSAGKYNFLVGPNAYYLTVSKETYQPYKSEVLDYHDQEEAVVDKDIALKKSSATVSPGVMPNVMPSA